MERTRRGGNWNRPLAAVAGFLLAGACLAWAQQASRSTRADSTPRDRRGAATPALSPGGRSTPMRREPLAPLTLERPGGMMTDLSPSDLRRRIHTLIGTGQSLDTPFEALRILGKNDRLLDPAQRSEILSEVVNELARRVERATDPAAALKNLRTNRSKLPAGAWFAEALQATLGALEGWLENQVLVRDLRSLHDLLRKDDWVQAANRAHAKLQQTELPANSRAPLEALAQLGGQTLALDKLRAALVIAERERPGETAEAMQQVKSELLSGRLKDLANSMRGLADIRAAGETRWNGTPDIPRLRRGIADFQKQSGEIPLAQRVQQDLAVKLFLEGYSQPARELLPDDGPPGHAADLLRDVKGLLLGRGEMRTWPARQSLTTGLNPENVPPAVQSLIPKDRLRDWRPPAAGTAAAGRPALEEVARLEKSLRDQVRTGLQAEREAVRHHALEVEDQVQRLEKGLQQQAEADDTVAAELTAQLQRPLAPAERMLVWHMRRQDKKLLAMTAVLARYQLATSVRPAVAGTPRAEPSPRGERPLAAMRVARTLGVACTAGFSGLALPTAVAANLSLASFEPTGR